MNNSDLDHVELELRQLDGVVLVAFSEREHTTVVHVSVEPGTRREWLQAEADRLAEARIDRAVVVEITEDGQPAVEAAVGSCRRVRLQAVVTSPLDGRIEVHLSHRGRSSVSGCANGDRMAIVQAVVDGLGELGLPVPFEAAAVHLLAGDLGSGALVVLRHRRHDTIRRGLATGHRLEEAIARAVLNALNRYLHSDLPDLPDIDPTEEPAGSATR